MRRCGEEVGVREGGSGRWKRSKMGVVGSRGHLALVVLEGGRRASCAGRRAWQVVARAAEHVVARGCQRSAVTVFLCG